VSEGKPLVLAFAARTSETVGAARKLIEANNDPHLCACLACLARWFHLQRRLRLLRICLEQAGGQPGGGECVIQ